MKFVKRPVAVFAMSFFVLFCVFACIERLRSAVTVSVSGTLFLIFFALSFVKHPSRRVLARYVCIVFAGALAASAYATLYFSSLTSKYIYLEDTERELTGTVGDVLWDSGYSKCYSLDVENAGDKEISVRVALITERALSVGDVVRFEAQLLSVENNGSFDSVRYYLSRGITLTATADEVIKIGESDSIKLAPAKLREKFSGILRASMGEESSSVASAVLLGNRRGLSDGVKYAFSKLGVSHLVAISGMHVSFVCGALFFILRRFGIGRRFASVVAIPAVVFYMFLTGLSPSVVRASLIACAMMAMMLLLRTYDGMTVLSLCGAAMVIVDPTVALDVSMQLSFCAYIGCVAGASVIKQSKNLNPERGDPQIKRIACAAARPVVFTCVIVLASLPVTLLYFDSVSLVSPLSNLLFIPAFSVVLYLSALVLILSPVPYVSAAYAFIADKFIGFVLWMVRGLSRVRGTLLSLRYPHAAIFAVLICVFIFAAVLGSRRLRRTGVIGLAASIVLFSVGVVTYEASRPALSVIRAGDALRDAICIVSGGESIVCDFSSGGTSSYSDGAAALSDVCIPEPGYYLMTRCDAAGARQLKETLEVSDFKAVFISAEGADPDVLTSVREILGEYGVASFEVGSSPDCIAIGETEIFVCTSVASSYASLEVRKGDNCIKYYPYGFLVTDPYGAAAEEGDVVIIGAVGKGKTGDLRANFVNCKIYSFAGELPGIDGVEEISPYSSVTLNCD